MPAADQQAAGSTPQAPPHRQAAPQRAAHRMWDSACSYASVAIFFTLLSIFCCRFSLTLLRAIMRMIMSWDCKGVAGGQGAHGQAQRVWQQKQLMGCKHCGRSGSGRRGGVQTASPCGPAHCTPVAAAPAAHLGRGVQQREGTDLGEAVVDDHGARHVADLQRAVEGSRGVVSWGAAGWRGEDWPRSPPGQ